MRHQSGIKDSATPIVYCPPEGRTCMQEVKTVIAMAKFDSKKASFTTEGDYTKVTLDAEAVSGLREYVATISTMYRDNNPFHNFEHACHVGCHVLFAFVVLLYLRVPILMFTSVAGDHE